MNISGMASACLGMFNRKKNKMQKEYESGQDFRKSAMNTIRVPDVFIRYHKQGFDNYKGAIYFEGKDREFLMDIREGTYSFEYLSQLIDEKEQEFIEIKQKVSDLGLNQQLMDELNSLLFEEAFTHITF